MSPLTMVHWSLLLLALELFWLFWLQFGAEFGCLVVVGRSNCCDCRLELSCGGLYRVSIQVMIDRWPGNLGVQTRGHLQLTGEYSQCPRQVTRKQKDTCRVMWPGNSMCPLKGTPSADKMTPSANRRTPAVQCHPGILNITHWEWGLGYQSHSPPPYCN